MAQQTAVEWLIENFIINGLIRLTKEEHGLYKELTGLAKQMMKEQIIAARTNGDEDYSLEKRKEFAEQYYKETYGKK